MAQSQRTSRRKGGTGDFDPFGWLRSALSGFFTPFGAKTGDEYEERKSDATPAADAEQADAEATDQEPAPTIDFAAMDPEAALYALLCREGGKMKQSAMVAETSWSKSKVSRRLSSLEESGRIGRVRQGREKVVFVKPGESRAETGVEARSIA